LYSYETPKLSCQILIEKRSFPNRNFKSQKKVNNKICTAYSDLYCNVFPNSHWPEILSQYKTIFWETMGKVLAHLTVGLKIIIITIKLDNRHNYTRI